MDTVHEYGKEIRFSYDELPEAENWVIGGKYYLAIEVEQVSMDKEGARFQVKEVKAVAQEEEEGEENIDEIIDEELESYMKGTVKEKKLRRYKNDAK